ncbi:MAG: ribosome biogenesis GTP-binding protein YihA/YsxC, partial [Acidobacteriota bacterium]
MKIHTAELEISAHRRDQFRRDGLSEVAFVGRSNVGKSSLMNRLLGRKKLARTSSTPGRTQAINYFLVNQRFYFVDLPGYGFAKASRGDRERWAALMDDYFRGATDRRVLLLQLIDAKVGATPLDAQGFEYFESLSLDPV